MSSSREGQPGDHLRGAFSQGRAVAARLPTAVMASGAILAFVAWAVCSAPAQSRPLKDENERPAPPLTQLPDRVGFIVPDHATARLGSLRLRDSGEIYSVAFLPDGATLASNGPGSGLVFWDTASGLARSVSGKAAGRRQLAMSKDGKILAVAGWAAAPDQLWSLSAEKTPKLVDEVLGNTTLLAFALSPDGKWLAEGREAHLTIWDVGRRKIRFQVGNSQEATASVFDVLTFSPNGKFLAFAGGIHDPDAAGEVDIQLWDVDTGAVIRKLRKHRRKITALAFSPDSKLLAAAIQDEAVCVWDLGEDKVVRELPLLDCCKLAFSPDGKELATADYQTGLIHLWNPISGEEIGTIKNGGAAMQSLTFSPDGKTLAAAGGARAIHLWNIETREEVPRFAGHCDPVLSVAFSPDGKTLASRSSDATVRLWDVPSGKMRRTLSFGQFDGRREHVCTLTFVPDGSKVIGAGGWFGPTHVFAFMAWNMASGETAAEVPEAHRYSWTASVSIAPDGDTVATADLNGIHMWSLASRKLVNELILRPQESPPPRQPTDCERCAIFSPDGRTLATCDAVDRVVRLWDWKSSTRPS